ncbi:GNAT family N-acetyltransferase [uncultured Hyphomonas sp.]|uniref:GNAT family N-acetyltransferase n=1 Tax=uncultured Hyphomonas sp. TaxID=225298 RepID=UPI002AAAAD95|nr:GNAT family N-acetyltransferase [uncultured Hyphomonas sp.]
MNPPTLTTDRLILRPFEEADYPHAVAMWGDADVVRYIGGVTRSPQDVWFACVRGRGMWDIKGFGNWSVIDRETGAYLGESGFADFMRGIQPDLSQWPEAGWAFARASWGRGIGSEAVSLMHSWLDENHPGKSVCIIDEDNVGSRRVAEKAGYMLWTMSKLRDHPVTVYHRGA